MTAALFLERAKVVGASGEKQELESVAAAAAEASTFEAQTFRES